MLAFCEQAETGEQKQGNEGHDRSDDNAGASVSFIDGCEPPDAKELEARKLKEIVLDSER